ncbi:MAG: dihydroorotate dehydrogenase, partial [Candidatus Nanopelagicales bacterium]|nr:dihydroorotate dehydrogenase [Candidatus Nanopelagicales bacterium]
GNKSVAHINMSTNLGPLEMPSPMLTASGCAAAGRELDGFFDITQIGAVVTKSVMMQARSGRATPRMAETPSGMLNSIGLQGPGIDSFIEHDLAWLNERGARTIVSIAGGSVEEFGKLASKLRMTPGIDAIEVNISCPNVENRNQVFACDPNLAANVIQAVRRNTDPRMPIMAKLSPDVTDIVEIADAVVRAGATGVSVINTLLGMVINTETMRPHLAGVTGGLSGPAIRPVAVRCVWQIREAFPDLPILGMGGVRTGRDALEFILAGANAVSVGTVVFHDPSSPMRIHNELEQELIARGFTSLSDAISYAHRGPDPGEQPEVGEDDLITE